MQPPFAPFGRGFAGPGQQASGQPGGYPIGQRPGDVPAPAAFPGGAPPGVAPGNQPTTAFPGPAQPGGFPGPAQRGGYPDPAQQGGYPNQWPGALPGQQPGYPGPQQPGYPGYPQDPYLGYRPDVYQHDAAGAPPFPSGTAALGAPPLGAPLGTMPPGAGTPGTRTPGRGRPGGGKLSGRSRLLVGGAAVVAVAAVGGVIVAPRLIGSTDPGCKAYTGTALTAYNKTIDDLNAQASQARLTSDMTTAIAELETAAGKAQSASVKSALNGLLGELSVVRNDVRKGSVPAGTVTKLNAAANSADSAC